MRWIACFLVLCAAAFSGAWASGARLELATDPPGLDAWADQRYLGRTPLAASVPAGTFLLRIAEPSDSLYHAPAVDTLLHAEDGELLRLSLRVGRLVAIRSIPFGLPLLRDSRRIGETPLLTRIDSGEPGDLTLLTPKGSIPVPLDTLRARGQWTWHGEKGLVFHREAPPRRSLLRQIGRYAMPAFAAALAAGGAVAEGEANRSYRRYQRTADPDRIRAEYDDARRMDRWAVALWAGAEVTLVSAVLSWVLPEPQAEPWAADWERK